MFLSNGRRITDSFHFNNVNFPIRQAVARNSSSLVAEDKCLENLSAQKFLQYIFSN